MKKNLTALVFLACMFLFTKLIAQNDCECNPYFILGPDANCKLILTKEKLGLKNCPNSYIIVLDLNPKNRDTIDASGGYEFGLYAQNGNLLCRGYVNAQQIGAPGLDSVDFVQDTLPFIDLNRADYTTVGSTKSLASPKANVYRLTLGLDGKYNQNDFVPDKVPNFGIPYFSPRCHPNNCEITVEYSQGVNFPECSDALNKNLYATLYRRWTAKDCYNQNTFVQQNLAIRRPELKDFQWNIPLLKTRQATLNYGDCTLDPKKIPLEAVVPILGPSNMKLLDNQVVGFQTSFKDDIDTICNRNGLSYRRTYYLRDCANRLLDTFSMLLVPGANSSNWISSSAPVTRLSLAKDSCYLYIPNQIDSIVKILKLKLSPLCPIKFIDWEFEYPDTNLLQRFNLERWLPAYRLKDKIRLYGGKLRVRFSMIDACNNLCTKVFAIDLRSYESLKINCIEPFIANLGKVDGKLYFRAQYRFARPDPLRQECGSIAYVRRAVAPQCLKNFFNFTYDIDQDRDYLEHFQLIKSGPYAGYYLTPWDSFVEAFECDLGQTVYIEGKVMTFDGRSEVCSSYFFVTNEVGNKAKITVAKTTTPLNRQVCVPVDIDPFINIIAWQFAIKFDPSILKFDSVQTTNSAIKQILVGYPGTGNSPPDRAILSWVYNGTNPVSQPSRDALLELCFTALKPGISKVWIDTTFLTELIGQYENLYGIRTLSGEVEVLSKNEIINRREESLRNVDALTSQSRPNIRVFPNPGTDQVQVILPPTWLAQGEVLLKDIQGRLLLRHTIANNQIVLNTSTLPRGLILIEMHNGREIWMERLVLMEP